MREDLLFETEVLWGLENKEQSRLRKWWDSSHNVLSGRWQQEAVMEKERV
jgi:hypothetical protein